MEVTIGGNRLGSGKKNKAYIREYERSNFDNSYAWRSTMAAGTLVPFMTEIALPGDTLEIELDVDILTHPTIGPLFGTYKGQLDVFAIPIRLYNPQLHMNLNKVGLKMSDVKLPQVKIRGNSIMDKTNLDNQQINPSCIFKYLGISGIGSAYADGEYYQVYRLFNAVPWLGYWDIYNQYYANQQEEIGYVIHRDISNAVGALTGADMENPALVVPIVAGTWTAYTPTPESKIILEWDVDPVNFNAEKLTIHFKDNAGITSIKGSEAFGTWEWNSGLGVWEGTWIQNAFYLSVEEIGYVEYKQDRNELINGEPNATPFVLANINEMKKLMFSQAMSPGAFVIDEATMGNLFPYIHALQVNTTQDIYSAMCNQEGLGLKCYQSDIFNNWIDTDWIDGPNGINEITAIDTTGGSFTIDELNLHNKIYNMLNRVAMSGGTYNDWLNAVYTEERKWQPETPVYLGGLSKELVFQEVISQSASEEQPLGTLAGRGKLNGKHKGGRVTFKADEPCYVMGIISLTPRIDYSQGNKWDTNLKTMDDFHKPALDEIGFQDLITDQMAWWDTEIDLVGNPTFYSAGKQPSWMNYRTNYNRTYGNFADETQQMWMTLNRKYQPQDEVGMYRIKDLTTYIDPVKYNNIFADTRRDAMNFWVQIWVDIKARRKMSSRVIPNL